MGKSFVKVTISLIFFSQLFSSAGYAIVKNCEDKPDFINELKSEINVGIESLPKMIFVARKVEVYIEAKTSSFRFHATQGFIPDKNKKLNSQILCATNVELNKEHFIYHLPTVIDTRENKTIAVWQLQVNSELKKFGFWSQRSRLLSVDRTASEFLTANQGSFKLYQINHEQYELQLFRENERFAEVVSILFDSIAKD